MAQLKYAISLGYAALSSCVGQLAKSQLSFVSHATPARLNSAVAACALSSRVRYTLSGEVRHANVGRSPESNAGGTSIALGARTLSRRFLLN